MKNPGPSPRIEIRAEAEARNRSRSCSTARFRNAGIGPKIGARRRGRGFKRTAGTTLLVLSAALVLACSHAPPSHGGSGKVPVEGALAASDSEPGVGGEFVLIYLNATPLVDAEHLSLDITLPDGVEAQDAAALRRSFDGVAAGATVSLAVRVRVSSEGEKLILATATLAEDADLVLRRPFSLYLNRQERPAGGGQPGTDADGDPLIIFKSGE